MTEAKPLTLAELLSALAATARTAPYPNEVTIQIGHGPKLEVTGVAKDPGGRVVIYSAN